MFRHILVPLDGSLRAERAIPVAARLARASEGTLILLRVVKAASEKEQATAAGLPLFRAMIQAERKEAQQYLTAVASSQTLAGLPIIVSTPQGSVAASIQAAIHTYQADLLVCCAQPVFGEGHQLLDSFSEQLCQHLTIPLLLLPAQDHAYHSLVGTKLPMTCLVVFDGFQPEPALIPPVAALLTALAGQESGSLHFIPLHALSARSTRIHYHHRVTSYEQERVPGRSTVLLKEARAEEHEEQESNDVYIMEMPLLDRESSAMRETVFYPRLLIPSIRHTVPCSL
jgi:nucleotide-binding universal stress UspA family protein